MSKDDLKRVIKQSKRYTWIIAIVVLLLYWLEIISDLNGAVILAIVFISGFSNVIDAKFQYLEDKIDSK